MARRPRPGRFVAYRDPQGRREQRESRPGGSSMTPFQGSGALSRGSGDGHSTGDLAVALPVGPLAGQEGIIRRRLLVTVDVERPGVDRVGARGGSPPVELPERPGELGRSPLLWLVALEPGLQPGSVVDSDLYPSDRRPPGGTQDGVLVAPTRDLGRG